MLTLDELLTSRTIPGGDGYFEHRFHTIRYAVDYFRTKKPKVLVETGCQSTMLVHAHGVSTTIWGLAAKEHGALLHTVDNSQTHISRCQQLTKTYAASIRYHVEDAVTFLETFNGDIDFLYLDSCDFHPGIMERARLHQLNEIKAAYPKLKKGSLVILDDAHVQMWFSRALSAKDIQGKTYYAHRFLMEKKARCIFDTPHYQRVYEVTGSF